MSLTNLLRNKTGALVLGAITACGGDQVSNYYQIPGSGPDGTYTCNDIYQRYVVECNANGNDEWGDLTECEKGDYPNYQSAWTQCIFQVPCEDINEKCDPLFKQF